MPSAIQLATKLHDERSAIARLFDERKQGDGTYNFSAEEVGNLKARNDALATLQAEYDAASQLEGMHRDVKGGVAPERTVPPEQPAIPAAKNRSFRDILATAGGALKRIGEGGTGSASFEISGAEWKTLLASSNITAQADRQPIMASAQFLSDVTPLFQPGETDSASIDYYLESTFTNNAAEVAEGTANTDAALAFTLTTDSVREINVWLPIARNTLADVPGLQSFVTGRLSHMLNTRRSLQLVAGDGTAPNISGILDRTGIQTQAKGADPVMDAIHKAMTKVAVTGAATPDAIVLHPNDWQDIRLTRTIDGVYILGNPGDAGARQLWGLPVVASTSITENTGLVGAFGTMAQLFRREGVTLELSTEHSTYFTERKVAALLYERLALAVYRETAFCSVTGI